MKTYYKHVAVGFVAGLILIALVGWVNDRLGGDGDPAFVLTKLWCFVALLFCLRGLWRPWEKEARKVAAKEKAATAGCRASLG
jgi:hypothetical protein